MVRLTRIYTRGGDQGETSLSDGTRVKKHALRIEAIGAVDEANAVIGVARLQTGGHAQAGPDTMLGRIQNDLASRVSLAGNCRCTLFLRAPEARHPGDKRRARCDYPP